MHNKSLVAILVAALSTTVNAKTSPEAADHYYKSIQTNPAKLNRFLYDMPKGGDLHNHHGGSSMAENMIAYAKNDHLCLDKTTFTVKADPACPASDLLENVAQNPEEDDNIIDAWSMRNFQAGKESGHDHFFNSFSKYGAITSLHSGEVLSEIVDRAGQQNEVYLELMLTPDGNASGRLGKTVGWDTNLTELRKKLLRNGMSDIVSSISQKLTTDETFLKNSLHCETAQAMPGCSMKVRYLYQVLREQPPEQVFGQLLAGFEAATQDPRIVGINMVQPEDGEISMRDYDLQMQMVGFLHHLYPSVHISLHAGELVPGLVKDEGLRFHIRDAVEIAHAERIGHGVDISYETNVNQLLKEMAKKHVAIEISLTSNALILDVTGKNHPLPLYMNAGVPLTLSTDDEGVDRTNMTAQYEIAASTFQLSYKTMKTFSRNAIAYSFLPGHALWNDYVYQEVAPSCKHDTLGSDEASATCQHFLSQNEKAATQWELEKRFVKFESGFSNKK
jgi:adenosine deaminase